MSSSEFKPLYARTGYFRRRPIEIKVDSIIEGLEKGGSVSLVLLDIDGFSAIEQEHNYGPADAFLETVASALKKIEGPDIAERYVRDSFVLVYNAATLEETFLKAEEIRSSLSTSTFKVTHDDKTYHIKATFSAGVSSYPRDADNRNQLISRAENAAKTALEQGGDRIALGRVQNMTPKTSHYAPDQLDRLKELGRRLNVSEAEMLREALDDLLRKYDQRDNRRMQEKETLSQKQV